MDKTQQVVLCKALTLTFEFIMYNKKLDIKYFNNLSKGHFPGLLKIKITHIEKGTMSGEMAVKKEYFAPNGYLHAGSIVTFADTIAGYATYAHLPKEGKSFTTLEIKSNFIGAIREGELKCECFAEHLGRTTQVWRAIVSEVKNHKKLAIFSCTQLILY